ncbi:MAG: PSD1 and planctomycete cytochrome C domain-containing protein [Pirellulaceae bacterium]|nr:PSD1 and planctomycete cytochrome C domain-containing protein [Pirellulaceae bacterium]
MKSIIFLSSVFVLACSSSADLAAAEPSSLEFFEKKIRPVLIEHCYECHGPEKQESELRVDHISFLTKEANYGTPIVPGNVSESVLFQSIVHDQEDLKMPEGGDQLAPTVIEDFRHWIAAGAMWPSEDVPQAAGKPKETFDLEGRKKRLPWIWKAAQQQSVAVPAGQSWSSSTTDALILKRLLSAEISPSSIAENPVWFRRVCFTLIGLPPTAAEMKRLIFDKAPDAKSRAVDRLLASPHYGERWARHWMDLMRYAESRGHESDFLIPNAWHYRDYLIQAFNEDLPYDRFVIEHLAGDLLEEPRLDPTTKANLSILATGWPFLGEELHSPVDIRQDECERIDNKVDVLSKAFLGITVSCARCHDHKFDAITQEDYYSLCGFFLSSSYRQVRFESIEHNRAIAEELWEVERSTRTQLASLLNQHLQPTFEDLAKRLGENTDPITKNILAAARDDSENPLHLLALVLEGDAATKLQMVLARWDEQQAAAIASREGTEILVDYASPDTFWSQDGFTFGPGPQLPGDLLLSDDVENPLRGVATYGAAVKDSFWDGLQTTEGNEVDPSLMAPHERSGRMLRSPKFALESSRLWYRMRGAASIYAPVDSHLLCLGPLHNHLISRPDSEGPWHGQDVSASEGRRTCVQFGAIPNKPLEVRMVVAGPTQPQFIDPPNELLRALLVDTATKTDAAFAEGIVGLLSETADLLARNAMVGRDDAIDRSHIADWLVKNASLLVEQPEQLLAQSKEIIAERLSKRTELQAQVRTHSRTAVALLDGNAVNERILIRGKYQRPSAIAARNLPTAFEMPAIREAGSGRLQLAQQIAHAENPLASRVIVNRLWHHVFGRGIVASVDNFGYLGIRPTHPELLDHLAWQFANRDAWSLKRTLGRLVLTDTFGRSSRPHDQAAETLDPENLLLHRMPIRRLEAEAIRDAVLLVSGRFDRQVGGEPVAVHHTPFVVGRGRAAESGPLDGAGRRSLYTKMYRNFIPTLMTTFDFPIPFSTTGRRNVTNVPGQSLAMMNDKMIYEQAHVWARQLLQQPELDSPEKRVDWLFRVAFGRKATEKDVVHCLRSLQELAKLNGNSLDASWPDMCHALFSMNEFIYLR